MDPQVIAILGEAAGFSVVWQKFFVGHVQPLIQAWAQKQPWWTQVLERKGSLAANSQDDTVLMFVLASHHMTAGFLLMLGAQLQWGE
jgi:hypothetical protein